MTNVIKYNFNEMKLKILFLSKIFICWGKTFKRNNLKYKLFVIKINFIDIHSKKVKNIIKLI